jgi:hypothetical protein
VGTFHLKPLIDIIGEQAIDFYLQGVEFSVFELRFGEVCAILVIFLRDEKNNKKK